MKGKIFFLDQGETLGGAERFLLDFFTSLSPSEIKQLCPVVVGAKNKKYREMLPSLVESVYWEYTSLRGGFFKKPIIFFRLVMDAWKLKKLSKIHHAKKFFSNTPRTHFVMLLAKKLFFLKGKWIVMNHDFTVPQFLLKRIARCANVLIANSIPCREYVRKNISSSDFKKIHIIENGICIKDLPDTPTSKNLEKILLIGRIDPRKGQLFALETADLLQERNPNLKFFIVGSPFEEDMRTIYYDQKIKQFIRERKLENVFLIPEVENPFEAMAEADCVLALPTEPETFGRIVIEGLSLNKLVLAFDETGPREILKNFERFAQLDETISLLVEKQNSMSLAERIAFFADHPEEIQKFVSLGREFVQKNFSLAETKKRLLNLLLEK